VAELYFLCAELDTEVAVVWFSRDTPWQQEADALSKYTDRSQWLLNHWQTVYDSLWDKPYLCARMPDVDVFADAYTTKVPGRFYSKWWAPHCLGVDAFAHNRSCDLSQPPQDRPLLYINPPFDKVGRTDQTYSCQVHRRPRQTAGRLMHPATGSRQSMWYGGQGAESKVRHPLAWTMGNQCEGKHLRIATPKPYRPALSTCRIEALLGLLEDDSWASSVRLLMSQGSE